MESISSAKPVNGVVLTFDDGFKDHYRYVFPELLRRGLWGIFYIPTSPFVTGTLIDVHRVHLLIGAHGGDAIADAIDEIIDNDMLSHALIEEFQVETYRRQNNGATTNYVKRVLNYFIDYKYRRLVIDRLMSTFYPDERGMAQDFYMTKTEISYMAQHGMLLGSHTVNHPVMSKLMVEDQEKEIASSFEMIESITGVNSPRTFCYPYGGFHSFTAQTERLLERYSCLFSFNVEPRDIEKNDLENRRQALPRFDCNVFPFGSCRLVDDGGIHPRVAGQ